MGWLRKKAKQIGRGIKKLGKSIGKGFKKVFGKVAKAFGKLGPLGSIAMMVMMPYVPVFWTNMGTWASGLTTSANVLTKGFGYAMKGLYHAGNAVGKVYSSVTGAIKGALNFIPGGQGMGLGDRVANFFGKANEMARNTLGLPDPTSMYTETSLKYLDFKAVNPEATLKDFQTALDSGQLDNTLADQGQAIMERIYKDSPDLQKANADKYNAIASSGERPVLEFNEATGQYDVISESDAIINRSQFEGFTIETPTTTEWISPNVDPAQIQAASQAQYKADLLSQGVPQTEATIAAMEAGQEIKTTEGFDVGEYATEKLGKAAINKGIEHLVSTDPTQTNVGYGGQSTIGLAQGINDATAYQTRPQELSLNYSTYAAPSYEKLYQSFLNMGILGSSVNALTSIPWFGTTPNYYGAGQQNI
jgi:hypothetical protein